MTRLLVALTWIVTALLVLYLVFTVTFVVQDLFL